MEPLRQVALHLHGLTSADRRWMLRRLPAEHRPVLRDLLRELKAIGIPKDCALFEDEDAAIGASTKGDLDNGKSPIVQADAADVHDALKDEPREVVAAVLQTGDWKWRQELIARYPASDRKWFEERALSAKGMPSAVRAKLISFVELRLEGNRRRGDRQNLEAIREVQPWWKRLGRGAPWRR